MSVPTSLLHDSVFTLSYVKYVKVLSCGQVDYLRAIGEYQASLITTLRDVKLA